MAGQLAAQLIPVLVETMLPLVLKHAGKSFDHASSRKQQKKSGLAPQRPMKMKDKGKFPRKNKKAQTHVNQKRSEVPPLRVGQRSTASAPQIKNRNGCALVSHREFVADLQDLSTGFTAQLFSINPGLSTLFPWLSTIANQYEKYSFKKCVFELKSACASSVPGSVGMVVDYDANDPVFTTEQQANQFDGAKQVQAWESTKFSLKPLDEVSVVQWYTRSGAVPVGADVKMYDVGNLNIWSTDGAGASLILSKLWVTYEVELMAPKINNPIGGNLNCAHFVGSAGMTQTNPLGTTQTTRAGTTLTYKVTTAALSIYSSGRYLVTINWAGTGLAGPTATTVNLAALVSGYGNAAGLEGLANSAGTAAMLMCCVDLTGSTNNPGQILPAITATTITGVEVVITQLSSGLSMMKTPVSKALNSFQEQLDDLSNQFRKIKERDDQEAPPLLKRVVLQTKDLPIEVQDTEEFVDLNVLRAEDPRPKTIKVGNRTFTRTSTAS